MLKNLLNHIKQGRVFSGLEISETPQGKAYQLLIVKQAKGELHIAQREFTDSLEVVARHLSKNSPLVLTINTAQVLTKMVAAPSTSNPEAVVNEAFPNLNLDNFYYELIQAEGQSLISIVKKSYVEEILKELQSRNVSPIHLHFGIGGVVPLLAYTKEALTAVSNYELEVSEGQITSISPLARKEGAISQKVNGLELNHREMLSFGSILGQLGGQSNITNFADQNNAFKNHFTNQRIFKLSMQGALIFVLSLLLINFLCYSHYFGEVEALTSTMEVNNTKITKLKELEVAVSKKEERLALLQATSNSKATYFLDQIAVTVPGSILLDQLVYQPLEKVMREAQPVQLEERMLVVNGIAKDADEFSNWIVELEKLNWISSVQTMDYDFISNSSSRFSLKISFRER